MPVKYNPNSRLDRGQMKYASPAHNSSPREEEWAKTEDEAIDRVKEIKRKGDRAMWEKKGDKFLITIEKQNAKLGFAVGDKVKILAGDVAGHYGKVIECMQYGSYLVQLPSGYIKACEGRDLEMC